MGELLPTRATITAPSFQPYPYYLENMTFPTFNRPQSQPKQQEEQEEEDQTHPQTEEERLVSLTTTNVGAGLIAGCSATLTTVSTIALMNARQLGLFNSCWGMTNALAKETIPSVAIFFTTYEHLKTYMFHTNAKEKGKGIAYILRVVL